MPKFFKDIFAAFHGEVGEIRQIVEISRDGVVRIDPDELVMTEKVQAQIRVLDKLIKDGQVEIIRAPRP